MFTVEDGVIPQVWRHSTLLPIAPTSQIVTVVWISSPSGSCRHLWTTP